MDTPHAPTLVVVSPHPDDAAFSASQAVRAALARRWRVVVVTVYSGSAFAPFGPDGDADAVTPLRRAEDRAWVARLGASARLVDLGRPDAALRPEHLGDFDPIARFPFDASDLAEKAVVEALLAAAFAGADAVLVPLGLGEHLDHILVRDAAVAASDRCALAFYEDLPYAATLSPSEVRAGVETTASALGRALVERRVATFDPMARHRDCLTYRTQIDSEGAWALVAFCGRYGGAERLWVEAGAGRTLPWD